MDRVRVTNTQTQTYATGTQVMNTFLTESNTGYAGPRVMAQTWNEAQESLALLYGDKYKVIGTLEEEYPITEEQLRMFTTPHRVQG